MITSDYRLWGCGSAMNDQYVSTVPTLKNVTIRGAIPRSELVMEQLRAEFLPYSCSYEELFCYSVAEAQCAGAFPITTTLGALPTTNMGWLVRPEEFAGSVTLALSTPMDGITRSIFKNNAIQRFGPERILKEWDKVFAL
jgi:hypothetical protein